MFETIKGLVGKLFPEARVEFAITLTADRYRTDVENVLRENNINPYGYLYTRQQVLCDAPKSVYESTFNTTVIRKSETTAWGKKVKQYEEETPATIPQELQSKISSVKLDKIAFHAAEK